MGKQGPFEIPPVQIEIGGQVFALDFDLPAVDEANLSEEIARTSVMFAHVGYVVARLDAAVREAKNDVDVAEGQADQLFRRSCDTEGKRTTEDMVKSAVASTGSVSEAKRKLAGHEEMLGVAKALLAALKMRADMVQMLGAIRRDEMNVLGRDITTEARQIIEDARARK